VPLIAILSKHLPRSSSRSWLSVRGCPPSARLASSASLPPEPHGHATYLARTWSVETTEEKMSAQAGSRTHQSAMSFVPANQRRYQGSRRQYSVLAAGPTARLTGDPVHRAGSTQRRSQRGLRYAHSSNSWTIAASRCAIWSGRPTMAASSKTIFLPPSSIAVCVAAPVLDLSGVYSTALVTANPGVPALSRK